MCKYRYVYYSRCRHGELIIFDYCDKARRRAVALSTPTGNPARHQPDTAQPPSSLKPTNTPTPTEESDAPSGRRASESAPHLRGGGPSGKTPRQHPHSTRVDENVAPLQTHATNATYASVLGSKSAAQSSSAPWWRDRVSPGPGPSPMSPAARLAARFEHDPDDPFTDKHKPAQEASSDTVRSMHAAGHVTLADITKRGRNNPGQRGLASTAGGRIVSPEAALPSGTPANLLGLPFDKQGDLDLASEDFPILSSKRSVFPSSAAERTPSDSSTSWAQVAGLTSAVRSTSSSTSGPTAESDAGTVSSTSLSSFQSDHFDPNITISGPGAQGMAHNESPMAKTIKARKPPPIQTNFEEAQGPRKSLPQEWLQNAPQSPTKGTSGIPKRKSIPSLRQPVMPTHNSSTSPTKSPTKFKPFSLATARRAQDRERREKGLPTKPVPAVPTTITGKATTKDPSKTPTSSDGPSSAQFHSAAQSPHHGQSFGTTMEEPGMAAPTLAPPSRIPRLALKLRRRGARSDETETETSPVRSTVVNVNVTVSDMTAALQPESHRLPSPVIQHIEDIESHYNSSETIRAPEDTESHISTESEAGGEEHVDVRDARSEMAKSHEAMEKAGAALEEIQGEEGTRSHRDEAETSNICPDPESHESTSEASKPEEGTEKTRVKPETQQFQEDAESHEVEPEVPHVPECGEGLVVHEDKSAPATSLETTGHKNVLSDTTNRDLMAESEDVLIEEMVEDAPHTTFDIAAPSQGTQWSVHYAQDLASPKSPSKDECHDLAPDKAIQEGPAVINKGPKIQKMSQSGIDLLKHLRRGSTSPRKLNAQATEFVPVGFSIGTPGSSATISGRMPGPSTPAPFAPAQRPFGPTSVEWVNSIPVPKPVVADTVWMAGRSHSTRPQMPAEWRNVEFPQYAQWSTSPKKVKKKSSKKSLWTSSKQAWERRAEECIGSGPPRDVTNRAHGEGDDGGAREGSDWEKWYEGGWRSVNGGPLTFESFYSMRAPRRVERGRSQHQEARRENGTAQGPRTDGPKEYLGYGTGAMEPCGNVELESAQEALPHFRLPCHTCRPERGP